MQRHNPTVPDMCTKKIIHKFCLYLGIWLLRTIWGTQPNTTSIEYGTSLFVNLIRYLLIDTFHLQTLKVEFQGSEESTMIDVETARHIELLVGSATPAGGATS